MDNDLVYDNVMRGKRQAVTIEALRAQLAAITAERDDLRTALAKVTDRLEFICDKCDDGFVNDSDWDIIADAHTLLAPSLGLADAENPAP